MHVFRRSRSVVIVALALVPLARAAFAQTKGFSLVALTLSSGVVLIGEDRGDSGEQVKVFNIRTGQEESYRKHKSFARVAAGDPANLGIGRDAAARKSSARPEAVEVRPILTMDAGSYKRLGAFPDNLAAYLAWRVKRAENDRPMAVLPLQDTGGRVTDETTRRTEELTGALVRRNVALVERGQLGKVAGELLLQETRLFDPELARQVGKQVGAGAVLLGTLSPKGGRADLNLRLVDVETGRILEAPTISDIPGLAGDRRATARASLVGVWEGTNADGKTGVVTYFPNGTARSATGDGTWTQNGLTFTVVFRPRTPPGKPPAKPVFWRGELTADGRLMTATSDNGQSITARKR